MSTEYRPDRPIAPDELRAVPGLVVTPSEHPGYAFELTDEQQTGYVHAVANADGLVIELRRFGDNVAFADRALELLSRRLGVAFVSSHEDAFRALDHRTEAEKIAAAERLRTMRVRIVRS